MLSTEAVTFLAGVFHKRARGGTMPLRLLLQDCGPESLFHNAPPPPEAQALMRDVTQQLLLTTRAEHGGSAGNVQRRPPRPANLTARSQNAGDVDLDAFLSIWAFCAVTDAKATLAAILYLGFPDTYKGCARDPR